MKTLSELLDAKIESDARNIEAWFTGDIEEDQYQCFKDGANSLKGMILELVEALEFYGYEHNWTQMKNDEGELKGNFLLRPDYGRSNYKLAGGTARSALQKLRKELGDE